MTDFLTVGKVAALLGLTPRRVQSLIASGKLRAQRIGRDYLIDPGDLELLERRPSGRPKKV